MKSSKTEYFTAKKVGLAINRYNMISENDKVLVGVSGGKDSLTLLKILIERKKWLPIDYEVRAVHVTTDYDKDPEKTISRLEAFFGELGCGYVFKRVEIAEKNKLGREDCFWCAWNRRKVIFETANEMGFNKVAFGHHKDDIAETIMMNLLFNGEISGINPVQELFNGKLKIIRPMVLLEEKDIARYARITGIHPVKSLCPRNNDSKRALVKDIIYNLYKVNKDVKTNILRAPMRVRLDYISDVLEEK